MRTDNAPRVKSQTLPSLQQELTDFVSHTEQRLNELSGSLSDFRQRKATTTRPVEVVQAEAAPVVATDSVAFPNEDDKAQENESNLRQTDPLARLKAIKDRLAAQIDDRDVPH